MLQERRNLRLPRERSCGEDPRPDFLCRYLGRRHRSQAGRGGTAEFRTISDRANYGAAIADLDGRFVYVNDAFARMHGWEAAELLGRPLSVFHSGEDQIACLEKL